MDPHSTQTKFAFPMASLNWKSAMVKMVRRTATGKAMAIESAMAMFLEYRNKIRLW